MNIIDTIKKAAGELIGAKRNLDAEIEKLRQRRNDLQKLPLPKSDAIVALYEAVDARAASYSGSFALTIAPLRDRFEEHPSMLLLESNGAYAKSGVVFPDPLYVLLNPMIKKMISDEIEKMEWPAVVGPARAERARELADVSKRILDLERAKEIRVAARAQVSTSMHSTATETISCFSAADPRSGLDRYRAPARVILGFVCPSDRELKGEHSGGFGFKRWLDTAQKCEPTGNRN